MAYKEVYEGISTMLSHGRFRKDDKLPPEMELTERFKVSRPTVNKVITKLISEGVLYKKDGRKGTFVNPDKLGQIGCHAGDLIQNKLIKYIVPRNWGKFPVKHGVMEGIYSVASEQGFQTVVEYIDGKEEWSKKVLNCDHRQVAGLVIWGHSFELTEEDIAALNESGVSYVIVDSIPESGSFSFVGTDNIKGAHMMVDHLVSLGHKKICYVTEKDSKGSMRQRLSGFLQGVIANNLGISADSVLEIDESDEKSFFTSIAKLVKRSDAPTAIFASHDRLLIKIYDFLSDLGVRCPDDISVAGYDDIDISAYMKVPLTTIKQDFFGMGKHAAELILNEANMNLVNQRIVLLLEPELIVRQSTGQVFSEK